LQFATLACVFASQATWLARKFAIRYTSLRVCFASHLAPSKTWFCSFCKFPLKKLCQLRPIEDMPPKKNNIKKLLNTQSYS
jgi:hypothetical protein